MARPAKKGLAYFSTDTDRYQDIKIKRLRKDFSCAGIAIWDYILNEIYRVEGSFISWDEHTAFDVADYFNIKESLVNEVVNYCCNVGLFNKELHTSESILTSKSIQKRYVKICKEARRVEINLPKEYDLINYYVKKPELLHEEIELSHEETQKSTAESTQSKVKKSKVKESTNEDILAKMDIAAEWRVLVSEWLEYKKERRESYKSERSIKAFVSKLKKMSCEDIAVARLIIEQSFANNWAGIFELKGGKNGTNRQNSERTERERQILELAREAGMA